MCYVWLQRTSDITYQFFRSIEVRYNEVLLYDTALSGVV